MIWGQWPDNRAESLDQKPRGEPGALVETWRRGYQ